jgi:uncharacterized protein
MLERALDPPRHRAGPRVLHCLLAVAAFLCTGNLLAQDEIPPGYKVDDVLVGACKLPPQLIRMGRRAQRLGPRRVIMASGVECGIRGGEYVAYDPADLKTAREAWTEQAESGDAEAQNYLGEIYERGLGTDQDYPAAVKWYRKAAEQSYAPAQFNLAKLYELGRGVERDPAEALKLYRIASGLPNLAVDPALQVAQPVSAPVGGGPEAPVIRLIDPLVAFTRGVTVVPTPREQRQRTIVGRVESQATLRSLTVNGAPVAFQGSGLFEAPVAVEAGGTVVHIAATDSAGRGAERVFRLSPGEAPTDTGSFGRFHALVIGVQNYASLTSLSTPLKDAGTVAGILKERYGYNVRLLEDPKRDDIMRALNALKNQLTDTDNLLIYYAGHGTVDEVNERGHWLPADAENGDTTNWIDTTALTDILNLMKARGVLVVADACYAGMLLRSDATSMTIDMKMLSSKRSRTALTSGDVEPVIDDAGNGHSVFANAFIDALNTNDGVLEAQQLLLLIRARVTEEAYARHVKQQPVHGPINFARHESGGFFFVPQAGSGVAWNDTLEPFGGPRHQNLALERLAAARADGVLSSR